MRDEDDFKFPSVDDLAAIYGVQQARNMLAVSRAAAELWRPGNPASVADIEKRARELGASDDPETGEDAAVTEAHRERMIEIIKKQSG